MLAAMQAASGRVALLEGALVGADLREIPLLREVAAAELDPWAAVATELRLQRRAAMTITAGGAAHLYLVRMGMVLVSYTPVEPDVRATRMVGPDSCLQLQCLAGTAAPAETIQAVQETLLVAVPAEAVRETIRWGGRLAEVLVRDAARQIVELSAELVRANTLDVRARAAAMLLRLQDRLLTDHLPISQEQLAALVGTRRETLALILGQLRAEGMLDTRYRMIKVLDRDQLIHIARHGYSTVAEG